MTNKTNGLIRIPYFNASFGENYFFDPLTMEDLGPDYKGLASNNDAVFRTWKEGKLRFWELTPAQVRPYPGREATLCPNLN